MLPSNLRQHISITCSHDINLICQPLTSRTPIKVIDYSRVFLNGSRLELSNHTKRLEDSIIACSKGICHIYTPDLIPDKQRYLLLSPWVDTIDDSANKILKNKILNNQKKFNIGNEMRIITRTNDYTEMFHFYTSNEITGIENFYLNNITMLEQFIPYFLDATHNFITHSEKQCIIQPWRESNSNVIILDKNSNIESKLNGTVTHNKNLSPTIIPRKFYFYTGNNQSYLTKREIDCSLNILQGKTNKEIADKLYVSTRTIEKHIEAIFYKTNCNSRKELVTFLKNKGIQIAIN